MHARRIRKALVALVAAVAVAVFDTATADAIATIAGVIAVYIVPNEAS